MRRLLLALALALAVALLTGCKAELTPPSYESRIKVDTPALEAAKAKAGIEGCPDPASGSDLPDLTLPCLGGGKAVDLADVQGPAVVSLWAQWCGPCRKELPFFQRLAQTGALPVLGLDWKETSPEGAIALLDATGATYPQVVDLDGRISDHYRVTGLPGMLLVDADGRVTLRKGSVSSYAELAQIVEDHTGVRVTGR